MKRVCLLLALLLAAALLTPAPAEEAEDGLILHLTFDEGEGLVVHDASGHFPDKEISYNLAHPSFQAEGQDPQWRTDGVSGGCLLLDGASTWVSYGRSEGSVEGSQLTVSAWIAPSPTRLSARVLSASLRFAPSAA